MSDNRINILVTHETVKGNQSSPTMSEHIDSAYQNNLKDLTNAIQNLTKSFGEKSAKTKTDSVLNYDSLKSASAQKTEATLGYKLSENSSLKDATDSFAHAVEEFNKSQERHSQSFSTASKALMAVSAPAIYGAGKYVGALGNAQYLIGGNDLSNPVGFTNSLIQNEQDKRKALLSGGAGATAAALAGFFTHGNLKAMTVAGGAGAWLGDKAGDLMWGRETAESQVNIKQNQIETQLKRQNPSGDALADLQSKVLTDPKNYGLLQNQFPNMTGINSYRGNLSESDLSGIANFNFRNNINGGASSETSNLIAQMSVYFPDIASTLNSIENYTQQYGGDVSQQLATAVQLLQSGLSPQQALDSAFKSGYRGDAFKEAQNSYYQSPIANRLSEEAISNVLGFDLSGYYAGNQKDVSKAGKLQKGIQGFNNLHGIDQMASYKDLIPSILANSIIPARSDTATMPTGVSHMEVSQAERNAINYKASKGMIINKITGGSTDKKMHVNSADIDAANNSEGGIEYNYKTNLHAVKTGATKNPLVHEEALRETMSGIQHTHDPKMKAALEKLAAALNKNTDAINRSGGGLR